MDNCIFCKIVKEEIPSTKVYEDDNFLAFLDIYPVSKGHTLLIPKHHVPFMQNETDENIGKIFIVTKNLMGEMQKNLMCDFVQISVVGEDVAHLHIHLIPRMLDDHMPRWPKVKYDSDQEMQDYANKIKG